MALATRCPACSTVFRITTAQAAAKGGMVRCGQCSHAFNSLDALVRVEELEVVEEESTTPAPVEEVDAAVEPPPPPPPPPPIGQAVFSEWWLPPVAADTGRPAVGSAAHGDTLTAESADVVATGESRDFGGQSLTGRRTEPPVLPDAQETEVAATFLEPEPEAPRRSRGETVMLWGLSTLALLVLLAQVLYVYRNEVVARWPESRSVLSAACAPLRCVVDHPARPAAITIEGAAVETTPATNLYVLSALLRNRDPLAIRYPYLELVLTDMQDRILLRRALRPEDYLGSTRAAGGFAGQSELPIRLAFELDGVRFTGYRLESFYP